MLRVNYRSESFPNYMVNLILKTVLISPKSVDPDEMSQFTAIHLGLHF